MCIKRTESKIEDASWVCDRNGWRTGKEWETTPGRLHGEPAAPSQHSSSSLPVCFAMVTRQGSRCSQLMCFSVAGASGVLMCLGLSPTQSMSTVLGCTNTRRADEHGTLVQPECGKPAWKLALSLWVTGSLKSDQLEMGFFMFVLFFWWHFFWFIRYKTKHTAFPFYCHISRC